MTLDLCVSRVSSPGVELGPAVTGCGGSARRGFLECGDLSFERLNIGMAWRIRGALDQQLGFERRELFLAVERSAVSPTPKRAFLIAIICASIDDSRPSSLRDFLTEKSRRLRRKFGARAHVFREKHGDKFVCHLGRDVRTLVFKTDRKSDCFFFSRFQFLLGRLDERSLPDEINDFRSRDAVPASRTSGRIFSQW